MEVVLSRNGLVSQDNISHKISIAGQNKHKCKKVLVNYTTVQ
jgi:hypothetical protein